MLTINTNLDFISNYTTTIFTPVTPVTNIDAELAFIKIPPLIRQKAITTYNNDDIYIYFYSNFYNHSESDTDEDEDYLEVENEDKNMIYIN